MSGHPTDLASYEGLTGMWDWEEAAWVNLKQHDKEKKEKVGDGKYPRREKRTRELP